MRRLKKQRYKPDPHKKNEQARFYAAWLKYNKEDLKEKQQQEAITNAGKNTACVAKFRAKALKAIPSWCDLASIEKIYAEAAKEGLHVDHIIPLRGKTVCGLHVPANLKCITAEENLKKGNRFLE